MPPVWAVAFGLTSFILGTAFGVAAAGVLVGNALGQGAWLAW
jgi:hypothetical protein